MKKGILSIAAVFIGMGIGALAAVKILEKKIETWKQLSGKHFELFMLMNQWVKRKQEEKNVKEYLVNNGYKTIAIYGMSYVGETLADELKDSGINILYVIDRNPENIFSEAEVVTPKDELQDVDAVIVTAITYFDEIRTVLEEKLECPIISLEDILYEV